MSVPSCLGVLIGIFGRPRGKPDSLLVEVGVLHLGGPEKVMIVLFLTVLTGFFFRGDQTGSLNSSPHSKPPKAKKPKKRSQDSHAAAVWGPRILLRPCIAGCASVRSKPIIIQRKSVVGFTLRRMVVEFGENVLGVHGVVIGLVSFSSHVGAFRSQGCPC